MELAQAVFFTSHREKNTAFLYGRKFHFLPYKKRRFAEDAHTLLRFRQLTAKCRRIAGCDVKHF